MVGAKSVRATAARVRYDPPVTGAEPAGNRSLELVGGGLWRRLAA